MRGGGRRPHKIQYDLWPFMNLTRKWLLIKTSHTGTGPEGLEFESVWEAVITIAGMLQIAVWKWRHQRARFWGSMFVKLDISTGNLACQMSRHGSTTYCKISGEKFKYLILRKVIQKFHFLTFWVSKSLFLKIRDIFLNNFLFYVFWWFLFLFYLKSLFLVTFQTFINFRSKIAWHWVKCILYN